jgi:hypothetical protein
MSSDCQTVRRSDRTRDVRGRVWTGCIAFGCVVCNIEQIMTYISRITPSYLVPTQPPLVLMSLPLVHTYLTVPLHDTDSSYHI